MKIFILLSLLLNISVVGAVSAEGVTPEMQGHYCVAYPGRFGTRVPVLPGWGSGATKEIAITAALASCAERSPFGPQAECAIHACYLN